MTIDCLVLYKKSNEKLITKKLKLLDFTQQSKPPNIRSPYFAVIDVLELKTKHQRLTQALEILNIAHLKFHTLFLSEKLEEMRKLLDSAMIERVKEFHHIKQTAELNSIKLTRDDFEPFLMKITRKLRGPRKNFQTQRQFNHIRNQALKELRLYTCEDDCESQDSNGKRIKSAKKKKLKKQKSKEEPESLDPLIGE